jgi:hypothetical protein
VHSFRFGPTLYRGTKADGALARSGCDPVTRAVLDSTIAGTGLSGVGLAGAGPTWSLGKSVPGHRRDQIIAMYHRPLEPVMWS